jgi:hypothetical protein
MAKCSSAIKTDGKSPSPVVDLATDPDLQLVGDLATDPSQPSKESAALFEFFAGVS